MQQIRIRGGRSLEGRVRIGGAKNAALPLMTASLLTAAPFTLTNVPDLVDIRTMAGLLATLGVAERGDGGTQGAWDGTLCLDAESLQDLTAPYDLVRKMRASILVLGPLLARCGEARVSQPGGCAIGPRPVDLHVKGLIKLGAEIDLVDGYIAARAPQGLSGADIHLPFVSVGATENLLMAATLARGDSTIHNAAQEPEIADLARCLIAMGARIEGVGTSTLHISGVERLNGTTHPIMPDRIETASYAIAAAVTGGDIELIGACAEDLGEVADRLRATGVEIDQTPTGVHVRRAGARLSGVDVVTGPFPGFATDVQAQMMVLASVADGASVITETIFENRFMHVPELSRMGADITVRGASAAVRGVERLRGAEVMATDLRASVSLVLAGLAAEGETVVNRIYHLDRGYERIEQKLRDCGADIERRAAM